MWTLPTWQGAEPCAGRLMRRAFLCMAVSLAPFLGIQVAAQTISPVIVEFTGTAAGKFQLTNNGAAPMAIVLEPKSFSIGLDGKGVYRPLDPTIHVDLSTMSFRLEPRQTYYVFYKAHADTLPAWFTVWAVFSPIEKAEGVKVRLMLPHTIYLYQKGRVAQDAIHVQHAEYDPRADKVVCDLENVSPDLVRVQEVSVTGGKASVQGGGFPLLPGSPRRLEIAWKQSSPPREITLHFPHFVVKEPLSIKDQ